LERKSGRLTPIEDISNIFLYIHIYYIGKSVLEGSLQGACVIK
jgi:hypothetical protein